MKRKWIALVLSVSVLAGTAAVPAFASEIQQEISEMPAVETLQDHTLAETDSVEENCVLVGLKGSYLASADAALKRINEIRKEACKQGVQDPRDPNRKLTMSDYVPVKWSSDLEYIARVRAAEASVYMDHQRPNGTMCFSQASPNGVQSWGEVLAWNNSNDMITGIDQWYGEKQDWVKQTGGVTGHYTSMINPNNLYVGLATFICPDADFKNTTSGEFSFETGLDEGQAKAVKNKVQKIQVQNQDVKAYMEPFKEKLASSKTVQAKFYANYRGSGFYQSRTHKLSFEDTVEWSSSNPKVAAVDEKGVVTGVSAGTAKITAKCGVFEESRTIQVTGDAKVQVKKITGVPKRKTLKKGKKWSIKAKATPKNVAKLTYKSSDKKVASVNGKGVVKAKKKGKTVITAKIGKKKLKCKITVKQKVVKKKTVYQSQMVENFESYTAGTDWGNYTLGEGLTSGGNEPAHYLAKGETMKVITDPENANNKVLQVIPKFYSFCPVFTVDLEKLTGISAKKLGDYKGIRVKVRVVSDASRHVGIGINSFFGKAGTINKKYAFNTYTTQSNALPNEKEYYKFY